MSCYAESQRWRKSQQTLYLTTNSLEEENVLITEDPIFRMTSFCLCFAYDNVMSPEKAFEYTDTRFDVMVWFKSVLIACCLTHEASTAVSDALW